MKGNLKRCALRDNLAFIDLPLPGDDLEASVTTEEPGSAGTTRDAARLEKGTVAPLSWFLGFRRCHPAIRFAVVGA